VKHLLIDGSNIVHAWPELKMLMKRDREAARTKLSAYVSVLHDAEQVRVSIVFDGRGADLVVERPLGHATFSHIYTPVGTTADDVIEQWVGQSAEPDSCCVATEDRAERQTIEALGASGISAQELWKWVERAQERQSSQLAGLRKNAERKWRRPDVS
jgi:predicted RNA-binding protein with PIN domain